MIHSYYIILNKFNRDQITVRHSPALETRFLRCSITILDNVRGLCKHGNCKCVTTDE